MRRAAGFRETTVRSAADRAQWHPSKQNAALALSALHTAKIEVNDNAIARGLATVVWPARFQRWDERTIIDGAHNPAGARTPGRDVAETFGDQQATLVLAVLQEKDVAGICAALGPIARRWLLPIDPQ